MLIDHYKAIEDSSHKMLQAARACDWEGLAHYEGACATLIEQLRQQAQEEPLPPEQHKEKTGVMLRILRNDAQIRCLTEPSQGRLEPLLGGAPPVH